MNFWTLIALFFSRVILSLSCFGTSFKIFKLIFVLNSLQIQTGHYIFWRNRCCYLCIVDMGWFILGCWISPSAVWHIYGGRSCLFHIYLCKSRSKTISTSDRTNERCHFDWTLFRMFNGTIFGVISNYGLLSIDVFVIRMWVNMQYVRDHTNLWSEFLKKIKLCRRRDHWSINWLLFWNKFVYSFSEEFSNTIWNKIINLINLII